MEEENRKEDNGKIEWKKRMEEENGRGENRRREWKKRTEEKRMEK